MVDRAYPHLYGPVPSRRLGLSLGVDLVPLKTCTYACIYCQLGNSGSPAIERKEYVPSNVIISEIESWVNSGGNADYITMSGSGEPTLHSGIGRIIHSIKSITDIPVAVITNGSLLIYPEVRSSIMEADLAVPSLDAGTEELFQAVNRPHGSIDFNTMVEGLISFSKEFKGTIWLEVFLIQGINTDENHLAVLKDIIEKIKPDKVHLNTAERPPAEKHVVKADRKTVEAAERIIGEHVEIVEPFIHKKDEGAGKRITGESVLNMVSRRPCSLDDMASSFNTSPHEILKHVTSLIDNGSLITEDRQGTVYYKKK